MKRGLLLMCLLACGDPAGEEVFASSTTSIAFDSAGMLWVTSPDDDRVVVVDPDTLDVVRSIDVQGQPQHLTIVGEQVWVTLGLANEVARVDTGSRFEIPCGGSRAIVGLPNGNVLVSCPHDDRLVELNETGVVAQYEAPGRPTALAVADDRVYVTSSLGRVRSAVYPPNDWQSTTLEERAGFAASQVDVLAAGTRGGVVAAYQRVDHDSDRDRDPARGGYGSVVDGNPRIEPRLVAPCGGRYAQFDGGSRVFSGPSALAYDQDQDVLWVVNQYTDDVAQIRCSGGAGLASPSNRRADVTASFRVGRGPRGIVVRDGVAWVDVGFDHAVARIGEANELTRTRELGPTRMSDAALRGRSLFHDADDIHLTPSGVVTCATCHPGGGEDGIVWFLHTEGVAAKVRRTPPAWGAREAFTPFHWDGEFTDARDLSATTIRELMEGDGLLIDLDAMAAYMAEVAPPPPHGTHVEGEAVFMRAGCNECHPGGGSDGVAHAVIPDSDDALANLPSVDTPPLHGIRARAPYLHDGRASTLRDVLEVHNPDDQHGLTSDLSASEREALIAYLRTL